MNLDLNQRVAPGTSALVVIDVQNDFCHSEGSLGRSGADVTACQEIVPRLHALVGAARKAGVPLVWVRTFHEEATDTPVWLSRGRAGAASTCRTEWGADYYGGLVPRPDEFVVTKHRYSAFIGTRMESVLHRLGAASLLLTGVATNVCVESTARDGFMLDFYITIVEDCCASSDAGLHDASLRTLGRHFALITRAGEIMRCWQDPSRIPEPATA